jgi:hypothetical protein
MSVRVLRVSRMPFNVDVWVEDSDAGRFTIYIYRELITERGAQALQQMLATIAPGWQRLDDSLVYSALRAVTG